MTTTSQVPNEASAVDVAVNPIVDALDADLDANNGRAASRWISGNDLDDPESTGLDSPHDTPHAILGRASRPNKTYPPNPEAELGESALCRLLVHPLRMPHAAHDLSPRTIVQPAEKVKGSDGRACSSAPDSPRCASRDLELDRPVFDVQYPRPLRRRSAVLPARAGSRVMDRGREFTGENTAKRGSAAGTPTPPTATNVQTHPAAGHKNGLTLPEQPRPSARRRVQVANDLSSAFYGQLRTSAAPLTEARPIPARARRARTPSTLGSRDLPGGRPGGICGGLAAAVPVRQTPPDPGALGRSPWTGSDTSRPSALGPIPTRRAATAMLVLVVGRALRNCTTNMIYLSIYKCLLRGLRGARSTPADGGKTCVGGKSPEGVSPSFIGRRWVRTQIAAERKQNVHGRIAAASRAVAGCEEKPDFSSRRPPSQTAERKQNVLLSSVRHTTAVSNCRQVRRLNGHQRRSPAIVFVISVSAGDGKLQLTA
ncbi:hypothetical protein V8D89_009336 [Ganoderma adspersum]